MQRPGGWNEFEWLSLSSQQPVSIQQGMLTVNQGTTFRKYLKYQKYWFNLNLGIMNGHADLGN